MVVVYGYGKDPMVLLTNTPVKRKEEVLSILKAYILRWRIEEMFRVQKSELQLENVRVRTLKSLNRIHLLITIMIAFMSLKTEKKNGFFHVVIARARAIKEESQIKMFLYRFSAGMKTILQKDLHGIKHFKYIEKPKNPDQLELKLVL